MASSPLQSDAELQSMMAELDGISEGDHFVRWRKSFVERLEDYLGDAAGVDKARQADDGVVAKMPRLDKAIVAVQNCCNPDTNELKGGVKSQMAINKLKEGCRDIEQRLTKLVPSNSADIKACGYTKFHLGAVLVNDGFRIYAIMARQESILKVLEGVLEAANVDRQILDTLKNYFNRIRAVVDVLADLGLYKVMVKTREFFPDPDNNETPLSSPAIVSAPAETTTADLCVDKTSSSPTTPTALTQDTDETKKDQPKEQKGATTTSSQMQHSLSQPDPARPQAQTETEEPSPERQQESAAGTTSSGTPNSNGDAVEKKQQPQQPTPPKPKTAKPKRKKKASSMVLPSQGSRGPGGPAATTGKRYSVAPPKNPKSLTPLEGHQRPIVKKPPPKANKNKNKNNQANKSNSTNSNDDYDDDDDDDDTFLVYFDPITQVMGKISRQKCIKSGIITLAQGEDGQQQIQPMEDDKDPLIQLILQSVGRE